MTCRIVGAKVLLFRVSSYKCASEGRGGDYCPRALGETSSRSHDRSVRALARKRQITTAAPQTATASRLVSTIPSSSVRYTQPFAPAGPRPQVSHSRLDRRARIRISERQPNIVFGHRRSGGFGANEVTQLGKLDSRAKCVGSWEPMKY